MRLVRFCFIALLVFLSGCTLGNESQRNDFGPSLLSDEEGKYAVYAVGKEITIDSLEMNGVDNENIAFVRNDESLFSPPILEMKKEPAFAVFDTQGVVYKTYNVDELINYLVNEIE